MLIVKIHRLWALIFSMKKYLSFLNSYSHHRDILFKLFYLSEHGLKTLIDINTICYPFDFFRFSHITKGLYRE